MKSSVEGLVHTNGRPDHSAAVSMVRANTPVDPMLHGRDILLISVRVPLFFPRGRRSRDLRTATRHEQTAMRDANGASHDLRHR